MSNILTRQISDDVSDRISELHFHDSAASVLNSLCTTYVVQYEDYAFLDGH